MIEAKDVAKKVTSGCAHSTPILVPCSSCVETAIKGFEGGLRDTIKAQFREEWGAMDAELRKLSDTVKEMTSKAAQARGAIARLESEKKLLGEQLKSARKELGDLKLCLDTERVSKQYGISGGSRS